MIKFSIQGHPNTLCTHKSTIEFTKDKNLTKKGDCILGVKADFDAEEIIEYIKDKENISITIFQDNISDTITATPNKSFSSDHEIVIRKSDFISKRTLAILADKAAIDIDRKIVETLKNPENTCTVVIQ